MPAVVPATGPTTIIIMMAALYAEFAALAAASLELQGFQKSAEQAAEGVIYNGGTPTLICIAGAIGGSFFSVCLELLLPHARPVPAWRLSMKFFMQPPLAVVCTAPIIHYTAIPFTVEMVALVSFGVGAMGVYLISLGIPIFEDRLLPLLVRRGERIISSDPLPRPRRRRRKSPPRPKK